MKKVPKDKKCDGYLGVDYSRHTPQVLRCQAPATKVAPKFSLGWDAYFCDSCYQAYGVDKNQK